MRGAVPARERRPVRRRVVDEGARPRSRLARARARGPQQAGPNAAPPAQRPLVGILMVALAVLIFACMDTVTKHLSQHYNVPMVMGLRYAISLVLMTAAMAPTKGRALVRTHRTALALARAGCLTLSSFCAALAFLRLPIAEATAVVYLAPFGVLILAGPMLGERVGPASWIAAGTGFLGMMLILRPGGGMDPWGVGFAVTAAAINVFYMLLSRMLASTESTLALLYYSLLVGTVVYGGLLPLTLGGDAPTLLELVLFLAIGAMGFGGHFFITAAYREAPASILAPINYLHIFWAGILGVVVFGHFPDTLALIGILMIAAAGAGIGIWSHHTAHRAPPPAAPAPDPLPERPDPRA
ncbi:MAG: DMT family transporter [Acuticoccus sp.]